MIQIIGLIIAVYAVCRLAQNPIDQQKNFGAMSIPSLVISGAGILIIGVLALGILVVAVGLTS